MTKNKTQGTLPAIVKNRPKRLGRGYGSGKGGHTSSRGTKGQKARGSVGIMFEGYKAKKSLLRRLPQLRGKGKLKSNSKPVVVNLSALDKIPASTDIDLKTLLKYKIVDERDAQKNGVKILGMGNLKKKFNVLLPTSKSAKTKLSSNQKK